MFKPQGVSLKHNHVLLCSCCLEGLSAPMPMLAGGCAIQASSDTNEGQRIGFDSKRPLLKQSFIVVALEALTQTFNILSMKPSYMLESLSQNGTALKPTSILTSLCLALYNTNDPSIKQTCVYKSLPLNKTSFKSKRGFTQNGEDEQLLKNNRRQNLNNTRNPTGHFKENHSKKTRNMYTLIHQEQQQKFNF